MSFNNKNATKTFLNIYFILKLAIKTNSVINSISCSSRSRLYKNHIAPIFALLISEENN